MRVVTTEVPVAADPVSVMARLAEAARGVPYAVYERPGEWSFGCGVVADVRLGHDGVRAVIDGRRVVRPVGTPILDPVVELTGMFPFPDWRLFGTVSFEFALAHAGAMAVERGELPLLHAVVPQVDVRLSDAVATVRVAESTPSDLRDAVHRALSATGVNADRPVSRMVVDADAEAADRFRSGVAGAAEAIRAGALQKVILSRAVDVGGAVDLLGTWMRGRRRNTPARSFLVDLGSGTAAAGFSPETVVEVDRTGLVRTQPLAGTRALPANPAESARLRAVLLTDEKELFEHAVSVKAAFDEMARVCRPGSVAVEDFMSVKERGSVQHLGSAVRGALAEGMSGWDALAALFPAVTASGIPKLAAYEWISKLEDGRRDLYGGAVLLADHDGTLDAALVLRTVFSRGGRSWLRAGAGVVGASVPEREYVETCEKLRSVADHVVLQGGAHQDG